MSPELMAGLVSRWVRRYTRDLPPDAAERRIGEIQADLHDHTVHERARGCGDRRIALSIAARMLRGLPADASWRRQKISTRREVMNVNRVAIGTALILVPLAALQILGEMNWGWGDFVLAAVFLAAAGLLIELALSKPGNIVVRAATAAAGVAAIAFGEADDAPGLVLFGCLLIGGTVLLAVRTALRSQ